MTQSSRDDQTVIERVRERLARRALPCDLPRSILVTRITGAACAARDEAIAENEAAYELEFEHERPMRKIHLHQGCYLVWDSECLERRRSQTGSQVDG